MKELRNINHSFDLRVFGIGVTIRVGQKWALEVGQGEDFSLYVCPDPHSEPCPDHGCKFCGVGTKLGHWVGRLGELPRELLTLHNESARDMDVLLAMLREGYGPDVSSTTIVTALIYERLSIV